MANAEVTSTSVPPLLTKVKATLLTAPIQFFSYKYFTYVYGQSSQWVTFPAFTGFSMM
jgi:hypothetical protein